MLPRQTNKLFPIFTLMLIIGAFCMLGATAYAAEDPPAATEEAAAETLSVDEVWLTGDTLHITVTDKESGETETLELNLGDYAKAGDEYVSVQATDSAGRASNTIKFRNPYYQVGITTETEDGDDQSKAAPAVGDSETATGKPFTPDGTGSVVDDATDGDGKEFFTVSTADGNVFYLIVDRQRDSDNVYLLNAVTEEDLGSLAKEGNGLPGGAVETPATTTPEPTPAATPEPLPEPEPAKSDGNTSMYILIVIAVLAVGGAGYYLKIVRPKKYGADDTSDDEYDEPQDEETGSFDDDEELDFTEEERGESE
jgi:hypothetical protein